MKALKISIVSVLFLALALGVKSGPREASYHAKIETFLNELAAGNTDEAYALFTDSSLTAEQKSALETLKIRTDTALKLLAKPQGNEFVKEQRYGKSVVRVVYLMKYERQPLVWEFYFYKPRSEWRLVTFRFNDSLELLGDR